MSHRKKLIAGNWKMNKTPADGATLVADIVSEVGKQNDVDVVVCPPFTGLESAATKLDGSTVKLGAHAPRGFGRLHRRNLRRHAPRAFRLPRHSRP
jgi:triosephosphate isomerase